MAHEASGMFVEDLHVEEEKAALPQAIHQLHEGNLRGVADAGEHGFAGEQAADRNTVQPAGELAVVPYLYAVAWPSSCKRV